MEVSILRWPAEDDARRLLADARVPRLLLVADDTPPPIVVDQLEDWIRLPAIPSDLDARVRALVLRQRHREPARPLLDADGVVRFDGTWVGLAPLEARLAGLLIERLGAVVRRDDLVAAAWPGGVSSRNPLDVHIVRLRRRLRPIGLVIRTIRARGYLLEAADADVVLGGGSRRSGP